MCHLCTRNLCFMAYSYDYKHTGELEHEASKSTSPSKVSDPLLTKPRVWFLAGALFMGLLLLWSWNLDGLFFNELIAATCVLGLVGMVKLQSEPKHTSNEKR